MATAEQVNELLTKMAEERGRLVEQVRGIGEEDAHAVPVGKTGEEEWTIKEQLAHLCEMELGYDMWVEAALGEENPNVSGLAAPRSAIPIEEANGHAVAELLEVMAGEREDTLKLIHGLSLEQFDRRATHPMFGTLTVMQWLRSFYRHDRMHADQIAGREPEYKPKFTGTEPNQRASRIAQVQARQRQDG
ncbi:MAG TPA: DinB family protein [Dehalococcoidia bacterium]|nr:DinB family protein [Dehalococcoidia bacterium]